MRPLKKVVRIAKGCVACGTCVKHCPKKAIHTAKGIQAIVNAKACVGCGTCAKACPAGIITLTAREEAQ
jgi:Pyruvate/2-oxoacid:ferredoxin oxidoreductase delta subunit